MKIFLFHIIIVAFCLLPVVALGNDSKCIRGDCVNGNGIYLFPTGEKYDGEFKNGKINGDGIYTYQDGSKYIGEFASGVRHGQGILKTVEGVNYLGQWANDLPNGQGLKILVDGMQYAGEFKNGLMPNNGTLIMQDGSKLKIKWDYSQSLQKDWYMTATPGDTQKLSSQNSPKSSTDIEVSSQNLIARYRPPSQELDQSAESPPEQVVPKASNVHEVTVKEKVQTAEVSKRRISEAEKPANTSGKQTEVKFPQNLETTKTVEYARISVGANIRSDASLTSEIIYTVPPGYPVAVLANQADWLLVEDYQRRKGWVFASLVKKPKTVIIKVNKGNLHRGPSLKDDVIAQLDHGKIMPVLERKGEWIEVSDFEGLTGWLNYKAIWPAPEIKE